MSSNEDSDSDYGFETCRRGSYPGLLPFDPKSLENIILKISDSFDFKVVFSDRRAKTAFVVTAGLAVAGGLIGKHIGGKVGAAVGGAVGGACGLGIIAISMREIWSDIKSKLSEVFEIVYDYLAGLGLEDYKKAAIFLAQNGGVSTQLGLIIMQSTSRILGKKILSSLVAA